jgi:hypothetical protein
MPPKRQEHNAKARAGTRKKGKLKKYKEEAKTDDVDPNAEIIAKKSAQLKDSDRKERLKEEVCCPLAQTSTERAPCNSSDIVFSSVHNLTTGIAKKGSALRNTLLVHPIGVATILKALQDKKLKKEERVLILEKLAYVTILGPQRTS